MSKNVMTRAGEFFDYEFAPDDADLVAKIEDKITQNAPQIMQWFGISGYAERKLVRIYDNLPDYIAYLASHLEEEGLEYRPYMVADSFDGNINLLSLPLALNANNKAIKTEADYLKTPVHEFVHLCQQQVTPKFSPRDLWLWEGLATNFAHQDYHKLSHIDATADQIMGFEGSINIYANGYTLVNYMLHNLTHDEILGLVRDPSKVDLDDLIQNTNEYLCKDKQISCAGAEKIV